MKNGDKNKSVAFIILVTVITDYNDLYCLFTHCIAPRKHYHVCFCDRRNNKL